MNKWISTLIGSLVLLSATAVSGDRNQFTALKQQMAEAACCRFEFLSILESDVFDTVDTTDGTAVIGRDGRWLIDIGPDTYLNDGRLLYSYSRPNNQVTVESVGPGLGPTEEIAFITRLDDYFETLPGVSQTEFRLRRNDSTHHSLPDSMTLRLDLSDEDGARLGTVVYWDINEDLNQIVFLKQEFLQACRESALEASFPDSVEVIRLD
jgi:hypothetical protein